MKSTRLSTKGQVVIPLEVRERQGWKAGTELRIEENGSTVILRAAQALPETRLDDLVGCAGYEGPRRSLEDMERAILEEARRRR